MHGNDGRHESDPTGAIFTLFSPPAGREGEWYHCGEEVITMFTYCTGMLTPKVTRSIDGSDTRAMKEASCG